MDIDVYPLLDGPWLRHLVYPDRVFGDIINQPKVTATRLGAQPECGGPESRKNVGIDRVDAQVLEADRLGCCHVQTIADVIIWEPAR
jgi:hypothetical protein